MEKSTDISKDAKIALSYLGNFDDALTEKLIGISEYYIGNRTGASKSLKNKVSFLIAECFQNVVRHGGAKEEPKKVVAGHRDFFQLLVFDDRAVMASCNLIDHSKVEVLEKSLEKVNSLDQAGLKKLYLEMMEGTGFNERGGAGLGLIEMARKSGLPLKFMFADFDEKQKQFFMGLEIIETKDAATEKIPINAIISEYGRSFISNTIIRYKGDLSRDVIVPIIDMAQTNFGKQKELSGKEKRIIVSLIETLQNVSKHAKQTNGMHEGEFSLSIKDGVFGIEVENLIEEEQRNSFESFLQQLAKMNADELAALYKQRLLSPEILPNGNCGLGLLEITRQCNHNMAYAFKATEDKQTYFSIKVNI